MTYEEFARSMKVIEGFFDKQDRVADFFHKEFAPDCHKPVVTFGWDLVREYIELLEIVAEDEGGWINYYLWECDQGRSPGVWYTKEGKEYKMRNHKDLWKAIKHDKQ